MNKNDLKLILILVLISLFIIVFNIFNNDTSNIAYVYYDNTIIKKIDLTKDSKYNVEGYNGNIHIVY